MGARPMPGMPWWGGGVAGWQPEKAQVAKQFRSVAGQPRRSLEPPPQVRILPELSKKSRR